MGRRGPKAARAAGEASLPNRLYYGDNLDVLRRYVDDESVDLIYLDPPFQSGRDHNTFFKSDAQNRAFTDTWHWDESASAADRSRTMCSDHPMDFTPTPSVKHRIHELSESNSILAFEEFSRTVSPTEKGRLGVANTSQT